MTNPGPRQSVDGIGLPRRVDKKSPPHCSSEGDHCGSVELFQPKVQYTRRPWNTSRNFVDYPARGLVEINEAHARSCDTSLAALYSEVLKVCFNALRELKFVLYRVVLPTTTWCEAGGQRRYPTITHPCAVDNGAGTGFVGTCNDAWLLPNICPSSPT